MFRKKSSPEPDPSEAPEAASDVPDAQRPKGRPTPSRRDAEQQRKHTLKVPADPKAAKKAMRERERQARAEARAGLMAGDPRYLPTRDQGPAKAFTRDFVDGRRTLSEYFIFVAVAILMAAFFRDPNVQSILSLVWFAVFALVILEVIWLLFRLNRQLRERWPDKDDRRGCTLYLVMRVLQIRRLRVPPPRVRPGGAPITPKG